jgi:hypothetical protein
MDKLSPGERILGIASIALLVLSALPLWAKVEAGDLSERYNLWNSYGFLAKLAMILTFALLILIAVRAFGNVDLPMPAGQIYVAVSGIVLLLMLISVLTGPAGDQGSGEIFGTEYEYSRGLIGLLGGVLASAAMSYGAYMHMAGEGSTPVATTSGGPTPPPAS